jgi:hypothetical protein
MKGFISYSHRDETMRERFHTHLAMLRREGRISTWYDRDILAGDRFGDVIARELNSAQLFLPLVSPDFLASNYCYETEMQRAMARHAAGEIRIVPIILRPCEWQASPLGRLKALPLDGRPISLWPDADAAWFDVVTELRRLVPSPKSSSRDPAPEKPVRASTAVTIPSKYRAKRAFDDIQSDDYRRQAFEAIRELFERSCEELDRHEGFKARFESMGLGAFTCTVLNEGLKSRHDGKAEITVRTGKDVVLGHISWMFAAHAPPNTANGGFTVASDDYELFLRANFFGSGVDERRTWTPEEAANRLWQDFIEKAGISHAAR